MDLRSGPRPKPRYQNENVNPGGSTTSESAKAIKLRLERRAAKRDAATKRYGMRQP